MPLEPFKPSAALTMGVELELQLVNPTDFDLSASASDLLHLLGRGKFPGLRRRHSSRGSIRCSIRHA